MSAASAFFSSSSRSIRSMNDFSRSPAIPPTSGMLSPIPLKLRIKSTVSSEKAESTEKRMCSRPWTLLSRRDENVLRLVPPRPSGSVLVLGREGRLLIRARLLLVLLAPFVVGHAVDDLARLRIGERDALFFGRLAIPARQTVAAEAGEVHQVDVLHVGALAQMRDQGAERRRFELGAGLVVDRFVHRDLLRLDPYVASREARLNGPPDARAGPTAPSTWRSARDG